MAEPSVVVPELKWDAHNFALSEVTREDLIQFAEAALAMGLEEALRLHPNMRAHLTSLEHGQCYACMDALSDYEETKQGERHFPITGEINSWWAMSYGAGQS